VKAERKAEREADPVKMKKYLKGMEYLRKWRENKNKRRMRPGITSEPRALLG
jgi:hypothetical protein